MSRGHTGAPAVIVFRRRVAPQESGTIVPRLLENRTFRAAMSALSGVFLFASFPTINFHFLVWVAVLPLLLAVMAERGLLRAFLLGYLAGAIFLAGSCYWFIYVMKKYGGMGTLLALGVLVLFLIVFSVFFGAFAFVECFVARRSRIWALTLAPYLWVAMEMARTYAITGFPWNLLGYAVHPVGLRQLASVTAVYGLSFLAASVSALGAAWLLDVRNWKRGLAVAGWLVLLVVADQFQFAIPRPQVEGLVHKAFLLQPNIPLDESKLVEYIPWQNPEPLNRLVDTTDQAVRAACPGGLMPAPQVGLNCSPGALVIWPENPAPFYFDRDAIFRRAMETMASHTGDYVITGTVLFDASGRQPRNSAVLLDPQGRLLLAYDKIHLVPFGEYVPWWAFPKLVGKITFEAGDFVPGKEYKIAQTSEGGIGVFICYESIFPQLVRRLVANGAGVLVNISDDGWFGNSAAGLQHLEMARMRAIENDRYLLRATNDGVTAIIDPRGEVVATLPRYQLEVLEANFNFVGSKTFYTKHGDVFAWLCVAIAAVMVLAAALKMKKKEQT